MAVQAMNGERQARIQATSRPQLGRSISRAAVTAAALCLPHSPRSACQPALGVEDFPVADLTVNGRRLETDVPSIIVDGQIMVSIGCGRGPQDHFHQGPRHRCREHSEKW